MSELETRWRPYKAEQQTLDGRMLRKHLPDGVHKGNACTISFRVQVLTMSYSIHIAIVDLEAGCPFLDTADRTKKISFRSRGCGFQMTPTAPITSKQL